MNPVTLNNATKVPFDLQGWVMHKDESIELIHLLLSPNEKLARHSNPFDVVFYVLSGTGTLEVEAETITMSANMCLPVKAGIDRGWTNTSNEDLRILVLKKIGG